MSWQSSGSNCRQALALEGSRNLTDGNKSECLRASER